MKQKFLIQSEEGRVNAINRFCYITAMMALVYVFILFFLDLKSDAVVMMLVSFAFYSCTLLNKKKKYSLSRLMVILSTNAAVFYFSVLLGFKAGIHLYLYTSPLICYLLYDFRQKGKIFGAFAFYLLNFLAIFVISYYNFIVPILLSDSAINLIYILNFTFSLILCFTLIIYFAFNNSHYTEMLVDANASLQEQQALLQKEITEKNKLNEELTKTVKIKDVLLQEIHHRVKNNLAVISGLVELQNFYVKDEKASAILKESRNRIKSIALLHEKFYENKDLDQVEIRSYVDELIYFLQLSFSNQQKEVKIHTHIDQVEMPMTHALPFSLLLNELITNSYKHAFNGRDKGNMYISLIKNPKGYTFHFKDDGLGYDYVNFVKDNTLGMNLVEAFSKQLKGEMVYYSKKGEGIDFKLHFNL